LFIALPSGGVPIWEGQPQVEYLGVPYSTALGKLNSIAVGDQRRFSAAASGQRCEIRPNRSITLPTGLGDRAGNEIHHWAIRNGAGQGGRPRSDLYAALLLLVGAVTRETA
jgi:hypothetical protein